MCWLEVRAPGLKTGRSTDGLFILKNILVGLILDEFFSIWQNSNDVDGEEGLQSQFTDQTADVQIPVPGKPRVSYSTSLSHWGFR